MTAALDAKADGNVWYAIESGPDLHVTSSDNIAFNVALGCGCCDIVQFEYNGCEQGAKGYYKKMKNSPNFKRMPVHIKDLHHL